MIMLMITALESEEDKAFMLNLYKNYYALVRKTVYNITRDKHQAEDLANDTFIKLIDKISSIRTLESCSLAAYVVYTSRSVAINFIKRRDVQQKHLYFGEDADLAEKIPSLTDNIIEERIVHQEEINELKDAILKLPEKQKELLYFKYILELHDREIANILNIAPGSVRQYLTRARREAKELIEKEMNQRAES
jgi:RNA polymerase sigma-70 factor (ECF subfamily)